jgi:hypothetical protein
LLEKLSAQSEQMSARLRSYERQIYGIVIILIVAMYFIVNHLSAPASIRAAAIFQNVDYAPRACGGSYPLRSVVSLI